MSLKHLAFALLTLTTATQAWANLEPTDEISNATSTVPGFLMNAETARQAKVAEAYRNGDLMTLLDEATPPELSAAFAGQFAEGYSEAVDNRDDFKFTQRFVVDLNDNQVGQRMYWFDHGALRQSFAVSGAAGGMHTPRGLYKVHNHALMAFSKKYDNSPMPCAFFFNHGGKFAIHGTGHVNHLGRPASHGCIRTDPDVFCPVWHEIVDRNESDTILVEIVDGTSELLGADQIAALNATQPQIVKAISVAPIQKTAASMKTKKAAVPSSAKPRDTIGARVRTLLGFDGLY